MLNPHMRKERACMGHPSPKRHPFPEGQRLYLVQAAAETRRPDLPFYRKYTEGMLRRYVRMSMEAGRVPSMLGREMFRARVTGYEVHSFEDVVIFVCDVERCVETLDELAQKLVRRIGMQEYTVSEVAKTLDMSERTLVRRYNDALDALTAVFLKRGLLFK